MGSQEYGYGQLCAELVETFSPTVDRQAEMGAYIDDVLLQEHQEYTEEMENFFLMDMIEILNSGNVHLWWNEWLSQKVDGDEYDFVEDAPRLTEIYEHRSFSRQLQTRSLLISQVVQKVAKQIHLIPPKIFRLSMRNSFNSKFRVNIKQKIFIGAQHFLNTMEDLVLKPIEQSSFVDFSEYDEEEMEKIVVIRRAVQKEHKTIPKQVTDRANFMAGNEQSQRGTNGIIERDNLSNHLTSNAKSRINAVQNPSVTPAKRAMESNFQDAYTSKPLHPFTVRRVADEVREPDEEFFTNLIERAKRCLFGTDGLDKNTRQDSKRYGNKVESILICEEITWDDIWEFEPCEKVDDYENPNSLLLKLFWFNDSFTTQEVALQEDKLENIILNRDKEEEESDDADSPTGLLSNANIIQDLSEEEEDDLYAPHPSQNHRDLAEEEEEYVPSPSQNHQQRNNRIPNQDTSLSGTTLCENSSPSVIFRPPNFGRFGLSMNSSET